MGGFALETSPPPPLADFEDDDDDGDDDDDTSDDDDGDASSFGTDEMSYPLSLLTKMRSSFGYESSHS